MQRILIFFFSFIGLATFSCSSGNSSGSGGGGTITQGPLTKGQGQDVGSAIPSQFTENGNQPQPMACPFAAPDTYQFDSRLQDGMIWELRTEVLRPSFGSSQMTRAALTKNSNEQLSFLNRMNFAVNNGPNYDIVYNSVSRITNNQPQASASATDALNQQNLDKVRHLMKSNCIFQGRSSEAPVNHYGMFTFSNGTVVPAIYSTIKNHGSWSCTDSVANHTDDAVQQVETVSSYAIPDFLAKKACGPAAIYSYTKVFANNANTTALESSRTELIRWINPSPSVTPTPNPPSPPAPAPTPLPPVPGTP